MTPPDKDLVEKTVKEIVEYLFDLDCPVANEKMMIEKLQPLIRAVRDEARKEENEAAAKIADEFGWRYDTKEGLDNYSGPEIAKAIRSRMEKK